MTDPATPIDHAGRDDVFYIPLMPADLADLAAGKTVWIPGDQEPMPGFAPSEPGPGRKWIMLQPRPRTTPAGDGDG